MKKNQKSVENYQRESCLTNRVILVCVAAALGLWGCSRLANAMDYASSYMLARSICKVLMALFGVGVVAAFWQWTRVRREGRDERTRVLSSGLVLGFALTGFGAAALLLHNFITAMQLLYVLLPVLAVLYLIYYTYQREFFLFCGTSVLAMLSMWASGHFAIGSLKLWALAAVALTAAGLMFWANRNSRDGRFRGYRVLDDVRNGKAAQIGYPLLALLVVAASLLGAPAAVYLLYATAALLFGVAVWATVRIL